MTDHKFEPGQLVLVRDSASEWRLKHFSHINTYGGYKYATTDSNTWQMCIPFNDDTKRLQNTSQPYEPPKPPVEYEWWQKVWVNTEYYGWIEALYVGYAPTADSRPHRLLTIKGNMGWYDDKDIRPLPDTAAQ